MVRGATARLFVALDPPREVSEELILWGRSAAGGLDRDTGPAARLRMLEPAALHLTLCFLGVRPVGEIEALGSALDTCAAEVGELAVGAPLWLPPRRPRALAVEIVDREGELTRLHEAVSHAISLATGWERERRRFKAHITVARTRGRVARDRRSPAAEPLLPPTPQLRFTPASVVLYRSWLSPAGASYEPLATCPLA